MNSNNTTKKNKSSRNRRPRGVRGARTQKVYVPVQGAPVNTYDTRQPRQSRRRNRPTAAGQALRTVGALVGGAFGMSDLGKQAGAGISRIFGQGDYLVNAPTSNTLMSTAPAFQPLTAGVTVTHREYVRDIQSSVGFQLQSFSINPGLSQTFPWLSAVAENFEEYKIDGMVVYLNTTSGTSVASTNTGLGVWGVVTCYDPSEPDFQNKQQAENYIGCQSAVPSKSICHGIECKPNSQVLNRLYVRTGNIADTEDLKFYDWGKFQVFTAGSQAVATIGEMWVSYQVTFYKPRLPVGGYSVYSDKYYFSSPGNQDTPFGSGPTLPVSGSNIRSQVLTLPSTLTYPSGFTSANIPIYFPQGTPIGTYLMTYRATVSVTAGALSVGYSGSLSGYPLLNGNSFMSGGGAAGLAIIVQVVFRKTDLTEGAIFIKWGATGNNFTDASVLVTQINPNLSTGNTYTSLMKLDNFDQDLLRRLLEEYALTHKLYKDVSKRTDPEVIKEERDDEEFEDDPSRKESTEIVYK